MHLKYRNECLKNLHTFILKEKFSEKIEKKIHRGIRQNGKRKGNDIYNV